jgi:hydroxypyruvate isomerase
MQISSVPGRGEPCSGELDDRRILKAVEKMGYAGVIGCEYNPAGGTLEGLGWMRGL